MGRTSYAICVLHTRPRTIPFSDVEFLKIYHIKSTNTSEKLQKVFTTAFKEAHPDWPIKQVTVNQE